MCDIGQKIGCDVPFFLHECDKANVSGFGEVVQPFDEPDIKLEVFTPNIKCSTANIYQKYSTLPKPTRYINPRELFALNSKDILDTYDIYELNDLYLPATMLHKKLKRYSKDWFFSGSGSSVFRGVR